MQLRKRTPRHQDTKADAATTFQQFLHVPKTSINYVSFTRQHRHDTRDKTAAATALGRIEQRKRPQTRPIGSSRCGHVTNSLSARVRHVLQQLRVDRRGGRRAAQRDLHLGRL